MTAACHRYFVVYSNLAFVMPAVGPPAVVSTTVVLLRCGQALLLWSVFEVVLAPGKAAAAVVAMVLVSILG